MTEKSSLFEQLSSECIVGVVRESSAAVAWECASTYADHGIRFVEITLTTPDAISLIERLAEERGDSIVIAAGSVRSSNDAADARRAGARMIVSPHTSMQVIEYAMEHDLLCVAGAATATEIVHAWEAGADIIKIYPAPQLGGADFIRTVRQPLPDIPMLAGGPVTIEQITAYLDAGAVAVNLGGSLALPRLVADRQWNEIGKRIDNAVQIVQMRRASGSEQILQVH
jgi:2-dehydro-3-deoxyphosphogluconate aldolase/(4S)-4-hydroxy-2-oxoglutarate aldolase